MSTTISLGPIHISLQYHESIGGHTIANHVGKPDSWLHHRLAGNRAIPSASTYPDLQTAESAVNQNVQSNLSTLSVWLISSRMKGSFDYDLQMPIGCILTRNAAVAGKNPSPTSKKRVILTKRRNAGGVPYLVLTSFPII